MSEQERCDGCGMDAPEGLYCARCVSSRAADEREENAALQALDRMREALREIEELADDRADVDDGMPNFAMRVLSIARAALSASPRPSTTTEPEPPKTRPPSHVFKWGAPVRPHDFVHDGIGIGPSGLCQAYVQAGPMTAICSRPFDAHRCVDHGCGEPFSRHPAPHPGLPPSAGQAPRGEMSGSRSAPGEEKPKP
jgi:hypothetical protein